MNEVARTHHLAAHINDDRTAYKVRSMVLLDYNQAPTSSHVPSLIRIRSPEDTFHDLLIRKRNPRLQDIETGCFHGIATDEEPFTMMFVWFALCQATACDPLVVSLSPR